MVLSRCSVRKKERRSVVEVVRSQQCCAHIRLVEAEVHLNRRALQCGAALRADGNRADTGRRGRRRRVERRQRLGVHALGHRIVHRLGVVGRELRDRKLGRGVDEEAARALDAHDLREPARRADRDGVRREGRREAQPRADLEDGRAHRQEGGGGGFLGLKRLGEQPEEAVAVGLREGRRVVRELHVEAHLLAQRLDGDGRLLERLRELGSAF